MSAPKLKAGQTLWYVRNDRRRPEAGREVTVSKVGRQYAQLANTGGLRVHIESGTVSYPGWGGEGKCYASEAAYNAHVETAETWRKLNDAMRRWDCPAGVTAASIRAAAELLGVKLSDG